MKKLLKLLLISAMMILAIGCICTTASATTKTSVKILKAGDSYTIKNVSKVKSSKTGIASAKKKSSTKYKITGKKKGASTLTVYNKKGKVSEKVYLLVYNSKTFKYNTDAINLAKGKTKTVTASTNMSKVTVKYASSDKGIATVSSKGKITAKKAGKATISAKFYYKGTKVKTKKKTVNVYTSSYNTDSITLTVGNTKTVSASVSSNCSAKYSSSDTSVATVNSSGKITAKKKGTATITCKVYLGSTKVKTYSKEVTVKTSSSSSSVSYSYDTSAITLRPGASKTVAASMSSGLTAKYSSNKTSVATVSSSGKITAGDIGSATITCKIYDGNTLLKTYTKSVKVKFENHVDTSGSTTIAGGKKVCMDVYCGSASDVVKIEQSNDCVRITSESGTYADDYNNHLIGYFTGFNIYGQIQGTCTVKIYVNGSVIKTATITVTSTDTDYLTYMEWKPKVQSSIWDSSMTNIEKVAALCDYVWNNYEYYGGATGKYVFAQPDKYPGGDCYAGADLFVDFAKDLGCSAEIIQAFNGANDTTHVWANISIDGETYNVDVWSGGTIYGPDGKITYSTSGGWR